MPDPVTGLVVGGASLLGGINQSNAASAASSQQVKASQAGISEQRRQFDALQALLKPYVSAGPGALAQQQALIGLGGPQAQQRAISGLESSPLFQAQVRQGEESLLQRASATGGLRGGNIQGALAQFRPQMLNQLIDQQYGRLGGITSLGQQSAAVVGTAGMQTGGNIANLLQQQGAAQAGGTLGQAQAFSGLLNAPMQLLGMQAGGGMKIF